MFENTMAGLEAGLKVRDIATFDIITCRLSSRADQILSDERFDGIDQFPVTTESGGVVGVLLRATATGAEPVSQVMRPLDDSLLISAEAPLTRLLPLMQENQFRLVLSGSSVNGIVTRSDILKLPVRVLAFTLVTHLEMLMTDLIRNARAGDALWLEILSAPRRKKVRYKVKKQQESGIDLSLLEATQFCDKRDIVHNLYKLPESFVEDLKEVEELRNVVAHAGTYADDNAALLVFVRQLELTQQWINYLSELAGGMVGEDAI